MASSSTVDGLVSGLNTSQLISQLMQVESAPQAALKDKVGAQQKVVAAYQSVNTKLAALLTASDALTSASNWKSVKASSSSDAVVATASNTATPGSITFTVAKLATAHSVVSATAGDTLSWGIVTGDVSIDFADGHSLHITPADSSISAVASAINAANGGVKAAAVQVSPGQYRLQVTSSTPGANSSFTVSGLDGLGGFQVNALGADAQLTVGGGGPSPYQVTSPSNTFTDVLPGVTFTAARAGDTSVTVSAATDTDAVASRAQAMVDAVNAALAEIDKQSTYKSGSTAAGPLAGDFAARHLGQQLLDGVSAASAALGGLKKAGIELTRDGRLTFDKQVFTSAYNSDAAGTERLFDDAPNGVAQKLKSLTTVATKGTGTSRGTLQQIIDNHNAAIKDLNDHISGWDVRLDTRRASLQRQFTALETTLGKMKDQSNWLSGQIASLPGR
jgi:flagellar hook-associated protein 2